MPKDVAIIGVGQSYFVRAIKVSSGVGVRRLQ